MGRGPQAGPSASASRYKSDNNENVPFFDKTVNRGPKLVTKVVQHPSRMSEPLSLINANLHPSVSGTGRPIYGNPVVDRSTSSRRSSISSSPVDFSNWKKELEARRRRLCPDSAPQTPPPVLPTVEENVEVRSNRTALMAVAKALSTTTLPRRTKNRAPRAPARNRPAANGRNWRSRQPIPCDECGKVFSNKFNLKQVSPGPDFLSIIARLNLDLIFQHVFNMHSKGGEVNCEQCFKEFKNRWYLRRHMVKIWNKNLSISVPKIHYFLPKGIIPWSSIEKEEEEMQEDFRRPKWQSQ